MTQHLRNKPAQSSNSSIIAHNSQKSKHKQGFTIVELLIVVVVIAILAAITIMAYNGITAQAKDATLKADLASGAKQLHITKIEDGNFPSSNPDLSSSDGVTLTYSGGGSEFCLQATNGMSTFYTTHGGAVQEGECPPPYIQTVTKASCPAERTVVVDARDNHSYFIQKLADGQCWMLTNLAYAGGTSNGGTGRYDDSISTSILTNGTGDAVQTYTEAKYYTHTGANPTVYPAEPSSTIDGGVSSPQFGYLYNFCGANGGQADNAACVERPASDEIDSSVSICPAGWRLPTGGADGDFSALNDAVNSGRLDDSEGLRSVWLVQYSGNWSNGVFSNQGYFGRHWSSSASSVGARALHVRGTEVRPDEGYVKRATYAVRCLAT